MDEPYGGSWLRWPRARRQFKSLRQAVGVWLTRLVSIELTNPSPAAVTPQTCTATNGVVITLGAVDGNREPPAPAGAGVTVMWPFERDRVMVAASATVAAGPPDIDGDGRLRVPSGPRSRAEAALEEFADLLAVGHQCARVVRSPMAASVTMSAADDTEQAAIAGVTEFAMPDDAEKAPTARVIAAIHPSQLSEVLGDRLDGVALMADALSEVNAVARARELFRFFERAFTRGSSRLTAPLAKFLRSHPRQDALAYSTEEVQHWLTTLRGQTIHADERPTFARTGELRPHLGRLEVAAYDVLFNKKVWRSENTSRRQGVSILSAVKPDRRGVVLLSPAAELRMSWLDRFERYPTDFAMKVGVAAGHVWATPGQRENLDEARANGWNLP